MLLYQHAQATVSKRPAEVITSMGWYRLDEFTQRGWQPPNNHDLWARASPNPDKPIGRYNHPEMSYVGEPS